MVVDVIAFWWVELHDAILVVPEHHFYLRHLVPRRSSVGQGNTDVFPSQLVARDDIEDLVRKTRPVSFNGNTESSVVPVFTGTSHWSALYPVLLRNVEGHVSGHRKRRRVVGLFLRLDNLTGLTVDGFAVLKVR